VGRFEHEVVVDDEDGDEGEVEGGGGAEVPDVVAVVEVSHVTASVQVSRLWRGETSFLQLQVVEDPSDHHKPEGEQEK